MKRQYNSPVLEVIEQDAAMSLLAGSAVGTSVFDTDVTDVIGLVRGDGGIELPELDAEATAIVPEL